MTENAPLTEQDINVDTGDNDFVELEKVQSAKLGLMDEIMKADGDDYYISKKDAHILVRKWLNIGDDD
jgi:hypothetical protein